MYFVSIEEQGLSNLLKNMKIDQVIPLEMFSFADVVNWVSSVM